MENFHVSFSFVTGFASFPKRTSFTHRSFCASTAKISAVTRLARKAAASCNASQKGPNRDGNSEYWRKAALSDTENSCGTAGPQAWAESCSAYCKRMGLLLAMPIAKFGCSGRTRRFIESGGHTLDDVYRRWSAKVSFGGVISQPLFHGAKVA